MTKPYHSKSDTAELFFHTALRLSHVSSQIRDLRPGGPAVVNESTSGCNVSIGVPPSPKGGVFQYKPAILGGPCDPHLSSAVSLANAAAATQPPWRRSNTHQLPMWNCRGWAYQLMPFQNNHLYE